MSAFDTASFDTIAPTLIAELIAKDGLSHDEAKAATRDYGRFLALVRDDRPTCPPSLADKAWHRHMESATYAADAIKLCGRALNHDKDAFGTAAFTSAWSDTRARWLAAYGQALDADATIADCGRFSAAMCYEQP